MSSASFYLRFFTGSDLSSVLKCCFGSISLVEGWVRNSDVWWYLVMLFRLFEGFENVFWTGCLNWNENLLMWEGVYESGKIATVFFMCSWWFISFLLIWSENRMREKGKCVCNNCCCHLWHVNRPPFSEPMIEWLNSDKLGLRWKIVDKNVPDLGSN